MYQHIKIPTQGHKISVNADMSLNVPDEPIIPYIEGDGTGLDITPVMLKVVDAAVAKAYGGKRKIARAALPETLAEAVKSFPRQALHAAVLGFVHPISGEDIRFEAPLPDDMTALLDMLEPTWA